MFKWPFNKKQPARYPGQRLSDEQASLIEELDSLLVAKQADQPFGDFISLNLVQIPLNMQHLSVKALTAQLAQHLQDNNPVGGYIPRSIAFVVSFDGAWKFIYATRQDTPCDSIASDMFIELLNRTNEARVTK